MKYTYEDLHKIMKMQSGLIKDICKPLFDDSGLNNYVFMEISPQGELTYLNSSEHYFNELIEHDIISQMPNKVINPFVKKGFHLEASQSKYIEQVFKNGIDNINEQYQLGNFLFVVNTVEKNGQTVAQISRFGTDAENKEVNDYYLNNVSKIVDFCHYFPVRMDQFLRQNKKLQYEHTADEIKDRFLNLRNIKKTIAQDESVFFYMDSQKRPRKRKLIELTPTERKIIRLSLKGYTADMISKEIFLSRRTVEKYFTVIKEKLECKYKLHIVGRLNELGVLERI